MNESTVMSGSLAIVGLGPGDAELRTRRRRRRWRPRPIWSATGRISIACRGADGPGALSVRQPRGAGARAPRAGAGGGRRGGRAGVRRRSRRVRDGERGVRGDRHGGGARRGLDVEVVPGITAMLAAAARLGAPLGHDFCAISLSDNLKPWDLVLRRLTAAAEAGFVIALYNPLSRARPWQLGAALAHAARTCCPARRRWRSPPPSRRPTSAIDVVDAGRARTPTHADMRTLVLIGSAATRRIERAGRPRLALHAARRRPVHDAAPAKRPRRPAIAHGVRQSPSVRCASGRSTMTTAQPSARAAASLARVAPRRRSSSVTTTSIVVSRSSAHLVGFRERAARGDDRRVPAAGRPRPAHRRCG